MKRNKRYGFGVVAGGMMALMAVVSGCDREAHDFDYDTTTTDADVKMITLRADHEQVLADGKAVVKFYAQAYGIRYFNNYTPTYDDDGVAHYVPSVSRDTFQIPSSQLPAGLFRLVDENGVVYPGMEFATKDASLIRKTFHLEAGELQSEPLTITMRQVPQEQYEEVVIPVIFHVLQPAEQAGVAKITITQETVQKNITRLNKVFSGVVTTDPNGADAHITFKAATHSTAGVPLAEPGVHRYEVPTSVTISKENDYVDYVYEKRSNLIYDYKNFLNIWLYNYPSGSSAIVKAPTVVDDMANAIPGLTLSTMPQSFPEKATDVGFFVNMTYFLNPAYQQDYYEISTTMATYLGLLGCQIQETAGGTNLVDGDVDYCPDTYSWWDDGSSVFKTTARTEDESGKLFTSYHVMDRYSYKNAVTVDQVKRMRRVLEHCPSRWMYKSQFAFTGKETDRK